MSDLNCSPIFKDIVPTISGQKFSTMYFGIHLDKKIILLKHEPLTLMLVFNDNDLSFNPEFVKVVSSESTKKGIKIVGNKNVILLLDEEGNLWRLINAFEFENEKDECLYQLKKDCYYKWVPFDVFRFKKVLDISALEDGFASIGIAKNGEKKLRVLSSVSTDKLEDYTFEDLNLTESQSYYLTNIKINIQDSIFKEELDGTDEALIISNRLSGRTHICSQHGKNFLLNISSMHLLTVINYEEEKCLLLCFQNGKLFCMQYDSCIDYLNNCTIYLSKKLLSLEKCYCSKTCLIWTDGLDLHHTDVKFDFDKPCFVKLVHLKISDNIKGITSLLKTDKGSIAVTINNFYYSIFKNNYKTPSKIQQSLDELLTEIYNSGLKINELNNEILIKTEFLKNKEMIQEGNLSKSVDLRLEGKSIILKSNIKNALDKKYWKIKLSATIRNKQCVEMKNLESDLIEGLEITIETDLTLKNEVEVSLVGDFGKEFDPLFVSLGSVGEKKEDREIKEVTKNLYEIAQKRNPYLKDN